MLPNIPNFAYLPPKNLLPPWEGFGLVLKQGFDTGPELFDANNPGLITYFDQFTAPRGGIARGPGGQFGMAAGEASAYPAQQFPQTAATMMSWLYYNTGQTNSGFMGYYSESNPAQVQARMDTSGAVSNAPRGRIFKDASNYIQIEANSGISSAIWHHVAVTWNGGTAASSLVMYIDGIAVSATTATVGTFTGINTTSSIRPGLQNGGWTDQSTLSSSNRLNGLVDDCRVYNRALSPAEILQIASQPYRPSVYPSILALVVLRAKMHRFISWYETNPWS